jgi:transcriptional regulator with XRE-family HTH domain
LTYELPPFGEVIKQSRLMHGLSQRELSERIGISYRQLMSLENGKSYPKYETLIALVEALHIPPEQVCCPGRETGDAEAERFYQQLLSCDGEDRKTVIQVALALMERLKETKGK